MGDSALAVDPVSGSDVLRALRTARAAADSTSDLLTQPDSCQETLSAYKAERDNECTKFLFARAQYYAAEKWFNTPFWQRRHVSANQAASMSWKAYMGHSR